MRKLLAVLAVSVSVASAAFAEQTTIRLVVTNSNPAGMRFRAVARESVDYKPWKVVTSGTISGPGVLDLDFLSPQNFRRSDRIRLDIEKVARTKRVRVWVGDHREWRTRIKWQRIARQRATFTGDPTATFYFAIPLQIVTPPLDTTTPFPNGSLVIINGTTNRILGAATLSELPATYGTPGGGPELAGGFNPGIQPTQSTTKNWGSFYAPDPGQWQLQFVFSDNMAIVVQYPYWDHSQTISVTVTDADVHAR